jgi:hypothetical protein
MICIEYFKTVQTNFGFLKMIFVCSLSFPFHLKIFEYSLKDKPLTIFRLWLFMTKWKQILLELISLQNTRKNSKLFCLNTFFFLKVFKATYSNLKETIIF